MTAARSENSIFASWRVVPALLWALLVMLPITALALAGTAQALPGMAVAIAALTLFVGALVASFSARYMRSDSARTSYFLTLAALVLAVLVFVMSANAILFAIAWVASGLLLSRLIGHADGLAEARAASRRSRATFLIGDAAVLLAVGILCWAAGSLSLAKAIAASGGLSMPLAALAALLLLAGAAARCALPPFSGWLLSSMTAPTPVSALMHAGLVNAGGFLLLRFAPVLEAAPGVRYAAIALGLGAAVWGIGIMAVRPDIKRSLAGSTISQMGFMIMTCGLGAYAAALWHLIAHGLFKAWLFLNAGSAIGMRRAGPAALDPRMVAMVSVVALGGGTLLVLAGSATAELVPLLLASATAAATFGAIVLGKTHWRSRVMLGAALAVLVGVHVAGFALARAIVEPPATPLLSPLATLALLALFLACWVAQTVRLAQHRPIPPALYVRLLNAGQLPSIQAGERP